MFEILQIEQREKFSPREVQVKMIDDWKLNGFCCAKQVFRACCPWKQSSFSDYFRALFYVTVSLILICILWFEVFTVSGLFVSAALCYYLCPWLILLHHFLVKKFTFDFQNSFRQMLISSSSSSSPWLLSFIIIIIIISSSSSSSSLWSSVQ